MVPLWGVFNWLCLKRCKQKRVTVRQPFQISFINNIGLPHDYSFSHHHLLFKPLMLIYATNMEIVFIKTNRMINLPKAISELVNY